MSHLTEPLGLGRNGVGFYLVSAFFSSLELLQSVLDHRSRAESAIWALNLRPL
jgi:hypothetical protein